MLTQKHWVIEKPMGLKKYLPISMHLDSGIYLLILKQTDSVKSKPIQRRLDSEKQIYFWK